MLLDIQDLDFFVGKTQILRSVSLTVQKNELVCLLGRNGAGKSSILKNTIGLYRPSNGKISLSGRNITYRPTRERVLLGLSYSPEDTRVFPELTVEENINLGIWITEKRARADSFNLEKGFDIFPGLRKLIKRKGANLSGGEKKMTSITRALALSPSVILLDESLEGLAPLVVKHFTEAMKNIRDLGISILLAESNLRNASLVAESAYIVERGEIIFHGPPDEIQKDEKLLRIVGR
jgi:branched-chain amino acid transport system ATP-binding protein